MVVGLAAQGGDLYADFLDLDWECHGSASARWVIVRKRIHIYAHSQ